MPPIVDIHHKLPGTLYSSSSCNDDWERRKARSLRRSCSTSSDNTQHAPPNVMSCEINTLVNICRRGIMLVFRRSIRRKCKLSLSGIERSSYNGVVVEVLSPSTEAYDRGKKFAYYQQIPTLQEYILISQQQQSIEVYTREDKHTWRYQLFGIGETVTLTSINATFDVAMLYERVDVPGNDESPAL